MIECLNKVPLLEERDKKIFLLYYFKGYTDKEIHLVFNKITPERIQQVRKHIIRVIRLRCTSILKKFNLKDYHRKLRVELKQKGNPKELIYLIKEKDQYNVLFNNSDHRERVKNYWKQYWRQKYKDDLEKKHKKN